MVTVTISGGTVVAQVGSAGGTPENFPNGTIQSAGSGKKDLKISGNGGLGVSAFFFKFSFDCRCERCVFKKGDTVTLIATSILLVKVVKIKWNLTCSNGLRCRGEKIALGLCLGAGINSIKLEVL